MPLTTTAMPAAPIRLGASPRMGTASSGSRAGVERTIGYASERSARSSASAEPVAVEAVRDRGARRAQEQARREQVAGHARDAGHGQRQHEQMLRER